MLSGMQLKLFECDDPPRPKYFSDEVLEMTLDKLMPSVVIWLFDDPSAIDQKDDEAREDLKRAIEFDDDSYEIVRSLDNMGWSTDRSLIDVMDQVARFRYESHNYLVEKWVLNNGVQPKAKVGEAVTFKDDGKQYTGEIIEINESLAKYHVRCPELGHVPRGKIGRHAIILSYEDVKHS